GARQRVCRDRAGPIARIVVSEVGLGAGLDLGGFLFVGGRRAARLFVRACLEAHDLVNVAGAAVGSGESDAERRWQRSVGSRDGLILNEVGVGPAAHTVGEAQ